MNIKSLPAKRGSFLLLRLSISASLLALLLATVRFVWFPGHYLELGEIDKLVLAMIGVVLVIGPGLSTLVYKPGKRGLRMDLFILLLLEFAALGYFGHKLTERRPQYLVFAVDRFQIVEARNVVDLPYRHAELSAHFFSQPRLVSAQLPDDPAERSELTLAIVLEGAPDIDVRPDHWYPYEQAIPRILEVAQPLAEFGRRSDVHAHVVDRWLEKQSGNIGDYVFLPTAGAVRDVTAIMRVHEGRPVDFLDIDPWE